LICVKVLYCAGATPSDTALAPARVHPLAPFSPRLRVIGQEESRNQHKKSNQEVLVTLMVFLLTESDNERQAVPQFTYFDLRVIMDIEEVKVKDQ
jgi:hypothetical protein